MTEQTDSSLWLCLAWLEQVIYSVMPFWLRFYLLAPLLQVALSRQRGHGAGSAWEILPCPVMKGLGELVDEKWQLEKKNQDMKTKMKQRTTKFTNKQTLQWELKKEKKEAVCWEKMEVALELHAVPLRPRTLRTSELLGSVVQVMMRDTARRVSLELTKSAGSIWRARASM